MNDGWLELYVGNYDSANVKYLSNKDGTFTDSTEQLNLGTHGSRSAWADFNNDGFLDVVQITDGYKLYRNTTYQPGNWLRLLFNGDNNNRMGYGNMVSITPANDSESINFEYTGANAGELIDMHLGVY